uniref:Lipid scramblase CLPTM1L n=1 Tax=Sinocyclocheilus anshuiensis TaxID=1608454 RepID=A0A671P5F1_9TELE
MWIFSCVKAPEEQPIVSYWRSRLTLNVMNEDFTFNSAAVPSDLRQLKMEKKEKNTFYLPLLLVDELRSRLNDLIMNSPTKAVPLTISYDTITLRKFRIWIHIQAVIYSLKHFGFSEQNLDEIKAMFVESLFVCCWLHVLALSVLVPAFNVKCFINTYFMYLIYPKESYQLVENGHAMTPLSSFTWSFFLLVQAMKFLLYLMYPLCISGAIYSYLYLQNKSWYSWITNGVYAFGFLSMVPQFDVFSGIITTPDDVVFLIYLYQRRIYKVSKSRSRDYGAAHRKKPKGKPHED